MQIINIFFASPGSIVGILLIEKIFFKFTGWNIIAIGIAIVSGLVGGYLCLVIIDDFQNLSPLFIQVIITSLVLAVHNISSLFKFESTIRFE